MRLISTVFIICIMLLPAAGQKHVHYLDTPFEYLKVSGNLHLTLHPSDSTYLEFDGQGFPESLSLEQERGKLILKSKTELSQSPAIEFNLHLASLDDLEISRGAVVQSSDTLRYDVLSIKVETGGKMEILLVCDSLNARVSQGSDIILYGSTRSLRVNANTMGNCLAYEFLADKAWAKAATGSQVKLNVLGMLNANASGGSFIGYLQEPARKEFKTSLGGKINRRNE